MKLVKMRLADFKGFKDKEFDFFSKTLIEGCNAKGKTTIMDAHMWLLTNRDSNLKSNPDIRPNDGRECIPRVEEVWEVKGSTLNIAKFQEIKKTESKDGKTEKISLMNHYEINGKPLGERDFKKDLTERGFDFENIALLSHIEYFFRQKESEQREFLYGLSKSKTDLEIASMTEGCDDVVSLLKVYRMDEIEAMNKISKKKAEEQMKAIPNQIIGLEKAKVDIDIAELELYRNEIKRQIENLKMQISGDSENIKLYDLTLDKIQELKKQKEFFEIDANKETEKQRKTLETKIEELNRKKRFLHENLKNAELDLHHAEIEVQRRDEELEKARNEYSEYSKQEFDESKLREIESEQFNENELICPTCGQDFPESKQYEIREQFLQNKQKRIREQEASREVFKESMELRLEEITGAGNKAKQDLKEAEKSKNDVEGKIEQYKKDVFDVEEKLEKLTAELGQIPQSVDLSGNEEYQAIQKQISDKEIELASMDNNSEYRKSKETELEGKRQELSKIESEIAKAENDARIDEQISELQHKQKKYAQKKADAEKILEQLNMISRAKNELLEKEINSWFRIIRFKLFDYFKNGEYKDCINAEVLNTEDGKWYQIGKTANTALEIIGKMDIIDGFQKFFGRNYPVFVDSATEMDSNTMSRIKVEYQTVFLRVTDGELEVLEVKP